MAPMVDPDEGASLRDLSGAGASFLHELPPDTRAALLSATSRHPVPAGAWVFRRGDPADAMYVVESGRVEVLGEPDQVLRVLGPGASFGEVALLTASSRSASVRARRDSVLLRLDVGRFETLLAAEPRLALALTRALGRWLAEPRGTAVATRQATVVVLTSVNPALPLVPLGERMVQAVGSVDPRLRAVLVTREDVVPEADVARYGSASGESWTALGSGLDRWEAEQDLVILTAASPGPQEPESRLWNEFCLRSADVALVVLGPADLAGHRADAAARIRSLLPARPELCFVGTREPSLIAGWLDALPARAHHVVSALRGPAGDDTVERMVRRLTGRSVGFVLSGGGARGFAHLGVLAAFRAAGVPIDRVGGCSIGSIIGALYAQEHSDDEAVEKCRRFFVSSNPLNDYALPRTALLRGNKLRRSLQEAFGPGPIEALPLPFFSISADLVLAQSVVQRRGPLWTALLASVSIPGLLPPVPSGDRLLVDGGVLNNMPIDVMADTNEGPVVAVDVMRPFAVRPDLPPIAETLARVAVLGSWRAVEQNRARAALTITVPESGTGMLDWNQLDAMVRLGRQAGEAALTSPAMARIRPSRV
jgi:NTE family protein